MDNEIIKNILREVYNNLDIKKLNNFLDETNDSLLNKFYNNHNIFLMEYIKFLKKNSFQNKLIYNDFTFKKDPSYFCGLKNIGNTCYFNSLLQVLFYIPEFFELINNIDKNNYSNISNNNNKAYYGIEMLKEIKNTFLNLLLGNLKYYNPKSILNNLLDYDNNIFKWGNQKDLSEIILLLLERVTDAFKFIDMNQHNIMSKIFYGNKINDNIKDTLNINNKEIFQNLIINIDKNNIYESINDSLITEFKNYKKIEWLIDVPIILNIQLKRFCYDKDIDNYKKINDFFNIEKILNISRFEFKNRNEILKSTNDITKYLNYEKNKKEKLDNCKTFDHLITFENLLKEKTESEIINKSINKQDISKLLNIISEFKNNMNKEINKTEENIIKQENKLKNINYSSIPENNYEIFAIIIHVGNSITSGHYYSFIKINNNWFEFNDGEVKKVSESRVFKSSNGSNDSQVNESAYSLFYKKIENLNKYDNHINQNNNISKRYINLVNHLDKSKIILENKNNDYINFVENIIKNKKLISNQLTFLDYIKKLSSNCFYSTSFMNFLYKYCKFYNKNNYDNLLKSLYEYRYYSNILKIYKIKDEEFILDIIFKQINLENNKNIIENNLIIEYKNDLFITIYLKYALKFFNKKNIYKIIPIINYLLNFKNHSLLSNILIFLKINLLGYILSIYKFINDFTEEDIIISKIYINIFFEIWNKYDNNFNYYICVVKILYLDLLKTNQFIKNCNQQNNINTEFDIINEYINIVNQIINTKINCIDKENYDYIEDSEILELKDIKLPNNIFNIFKKLIYNEINFNDSKKNYYDYLMTFINEEDLNFYN